MANPITWKNVAAPNFNASNVLAMNAAKQLGDAFQSGSDRLIEQGEFNEKQNTDALIGKIGAYQDYDALANAKAGIFSGMDGQNIDEGAIADYFGTQQTALGQREEFNVGRKDRADTESGNAFARKLMNSGVTNQREVQSAVMAEGLKQGWSDTSTSNVFSSIDRDFAPTVEEAAKTATDAATLKFQRGMQEQAAKDAAALDREYAGNSKGGSAANTGLIEGADQGFWGSVFTWGDGKERGEAYASNFLNSSSAKLGGNKAAGNKAREIYSKYTDSRGVTDYSAANEEVAQQVAANLQRDAYNGASILEKRMQAESLAAQSNGALTVKQATKMLNDRYGSK